MSFFPSSCEIINKRFTIKETLRKRRITAGVTTTDRDSDSDNRVGVKISDDVDWAGVTRPSLSHEDTIRKTYGDNLRLTLIYGEPYLRKLYGYDKLLDSKSKCYELEPVPIVKEQTFKYGVGRFLSYNAKTSHLVRFKDGVLQDEPVEFGSLTEKYLLICCFNVPMLSEAATAFFIRSLIETYDEFSRRGYPFEMIVVANLRTDIVYDLKAAFYHFYSAFSCLAIPFSDFQTRDYIHECMSLQWPGAVDLELDSAILVNPYGLIMQNRDSALGHFLNYGFEWKPPFRTFALDAIDEQDHLLRCRFDPMYPKYPMSYKTVGRVHSQPPLSLYRDVLLCNPYFTLRRFDAAGCSTVLELSRKYVGLYLFIDGEIMEDIKAAHDHCLANNQQLEILLLPMPLYDEPNSYFKQLYQALRSLNIKSWFLLFHHAKARRRLWRIFGRECRVSEEKFIIIPPDCESGELCGREVVIKLGVDQYPFTRTAILKQRLEYYRSLTPIFSSSLFDNCQMIQNGKEFKSEQLQGKNVLLYLSWTERDRYSLMKEHYPEIKAMGWEVVLVLLDYTDRYWNKKGWSIDYQKWPCFNLEELPWPYMLLSAAAGPSIKKLFFRRADRDTVYLVAVGKDGKIVSRDVKHRLESDGVTESLFNDVLEADLRLVLGSMRK